MTRGPRRPRAELLEPRTLLASFLDPTFGSGGAVDVTVPTSGIDAAGAVLALPGGKVLAAGSSSPVSAGIRAAFALARYNPDGSLDSLFGAGGLAVVPARESAAINALALQGDGKVLAAGRVGSLMAVARFTADGALDTTFAGDGVVTSGRLPGAANDVVLQSDGRIVVAADGFNVLRLLPDGQFDPSFGNGDGIADANFGVQGRSAATGVRVLGDGKVLASGRALVQDGASAFNAVALVRFNPDGSLDTAFGTGGKVVTQVSTASQTSVEDMTLAPDGDVVVAGRTGPLPAVWNDGFVVRYDASGALDASFDGDGRLIVPSTPFVAVEVQSGGQVLAGAVPRQLVGHVALEIYGYLPNGATDPSFGGGDGRASAFVFPSFNTTLADIDLADDGRIVAAGTRGGDFALARFTASGLADATFGGGDGELTTNFPARVPLAGTAMTRDDQGRLYVAGYRGDATNRADAYTVVRYNPDGSLDTSFGSGGVASPPDDIVGFYYGIPAEVLVTPDKKVVVVGWASRDPAAPYNGGAFGIVRYTENGVPDATFGQNGVVRTPPPQNDEAVAVAAAPGGKIVVVGTAHTGSSPVARYNPDGSLDSTFGDGGFIAAPQGTAYYDVVVQDDGKVVAVGSRYDGFEEGYTAVVGRYNPDGTPDATFDGDGVVVLPPLPAPPSDPGNAGMYAVALLPGGKILVGGYQESADFTVLRLNADGSLDETFGDGGRVVTEFSGPIGTFASNVRFLRVNPDGSFFAAGTAGSSIGVDRFAVAAYNADGSPLTGFGEGGSGRLLVPEVASAYVTVPGGFVTTDDAKPVVLLPGSLAGVVLRLARTAPPHDTAVVGRHAFYKNSVYGRRGDVLAREEDAIAADKRPLLPGGTATFDNVLSYPGGVGGIIVDLAGLPRDVVLTADDFVFRAGTGGDPSTWADITLGANVNFRRGGGAGGSDRVTIWWDDGTEPRNRWLQVTVKADDDTGLARPDVFYFGSQFGETGDGASPLRVSALDLAAVKRSLGRDATITDPLDLNRDGLINALDLALVRQNLGRSLARLVAPAPVQLSELSPGGAADGSPRRKPWESDEA